MTDTLSKNGKSANASSMKGKISFSSFIMKDKRSNLPREGKKAEKTSISINFNKEKLGD